MQGTWVRSLIQEPRIHMLWSNLAHAPRLLKPMHAWAWVLQQEKPSQWEACAPQLERARTLQRRASVTKKRERERSCWKSPYFAAGNLICDNSLVCHLTISATLWPQVKIPESGVGGPRAHCMSGDPSPVNLDSGNDCPRSTRRPWCRLCGRSQSGRGARQAVPWVFMAPRAVCSASTQFLTSCLLPGTPSHAPFYPDQSSLSFISCLRKHFLQEVFSSSKLPTLG